VSSENLIGADVEELIGMFPEAKLTMRDRLPISLILTSAILTIQKSILNIDYSEEELREAVMGFVAMLPDELKDDEFNNELDAAKLRRPVNTRPEFCGVAASDEYCQRNSIDTVRYVDTFDYFKVFHACFNLLHRRHMLMKSEEKEIATGVKARGEEPAYEPDTEECET